MFDVRCLFIYVNLYNELEQTDQQIAERRLVLQATEIELARLLAMRAAIFEATAKDESPSPIAAAPPSEMPNLQMLHRTDAVLQVLTLGASPMSIPEVWDGLKAGGRTEPKYQVVASTLSLLVKQGRAVRPTRGRYIAA